MPNAISHVVSTQIGGVKARAEAAERDVGVDRAPRLVEERTEEEDAGWRWLPNSNGREGRDRSHAAQAMNARTAHEVEQDGFDLIIAVVRDHHGLGCEALGGIGQSVISR